MRMKMKGFLTNTIYELKVSAEEDAFVYIRAFKDGEIGFSVLDEATLKPDFSNCGVFWVRENDFKRVFKPCSPKKVFKNTEVTEVAVE